MEEGLRKNVRLDVVLAILKEADPSLHLDVKNNFDDRLRLQKYVYLIQRLGLSLGYRFNEYLRGPYSPELAMDYYAFEDAVRELRTEHKLSEEERRIADKLKGVMKLSPNELEALGFMLMKGWLCDEDVLVNVRFNKSHLTVEEVRRAMEEGRKIFRC